MYKIVNMKQYLILALFSIINFTVVAQKEVGGVKIPEVYNIENNMLKLNGAGIREKYFLDMYIGALYLKQKNIDAQKIIEADEPMAIKLHIVSGMITSEKMSTAIDEGFKNSTANNVAPYQGGINQFKKAFSEKINVNDVFDIVYIPGKGTTVFKNGKQVAFIQGVAFKKALFGIWLCNKPADEDLKDALLGKE